jgi:polygalacturonase
MEHTWYERQKSLNIPNVEKTLDWLSEDSSANLCSAQIQGKLFLPAENIVVTQLDVQQWRDAERVGSETTGRVPNVAISNCACENSTCGMYFRATRGRGNGVENTSAPSFVMRGIGDGCGQHAM